MNLQFIKSANIEIIKTMLLLIFGCTLIAIATSINSTIKNFGILTVTHSRNGDYSILQKYLALYTQTACYSEFISEINLVWNNEQAPEDTVIWHRRDKWKIPVYFYRTTFNSMDHRYRLPKASKAQLLYSLDDDIVVDCATFKTTLQEYNLVNKNQELGRMVANQVRGSYFRLSITKGEFGYQGQPTNSYFTIAEPGAAFIPRHYLQIYYLSLKELMQLRAIILQVKNCDDVFFYASVQHFYPQLPTVYKIGSKDYKNTDPKVGQSKVKNISAIRHRCMQSITEALGYNPLRYFSKNSTKYMQNWKFNNIDLIIDEKKKGMSGVLMEDGIERPSNRTNTNKGIQVSSKTLVSQKTISANNSGQSTKKNIEKLLSPQLQKKELPQILQLQDTTNFQQESASNKQNIKTSFKFIHKIIGLIFIIIILIIVLRKLWKGYKLASVQQYSVRVNQIQQETLQPGSLSTSQNRDI